MTRASLRPVAAVIAANVLFGTGLFFHAFLYNFYLESLGHSEVVMGLAAAALTAGGLVSLLPAGALADRIGPGSALALGAVLGGVALGAGAVVEAPAWIYVAAALAGAGGGIWRVGVAPVFMRLTDAELRPRAFAANVGLLVLSGGLGMAVAGAVPGWLQAAWGLGALSAIRLALLAGAVGTLISAGLFWWISVAPSTTAVDDRATGAAGADLRSRVPEVLPLIGLIAVWMLGPALAAPFFNIFFSRSFALPIDRVGVIFAATHIVWGIAVFASGEIAGRLGVRRTLAWALLGFAPAMLALSFAETLSLAITLYFLQGVISPITNPLIDQVLLEHVPPARHGAVSSWRNVAADVSAMAGAALGGKVLASLSFGWLFTASAAIGLVGALGLVIGVARFAVTRPVESVPRQGP